MFIQLERWACRKCHTERGWGYTAGYRSFKLPHEAQLNCRTCGAVTTHVYVPNAPLTEIFREHRSAYGHPNMQHGSEGDKQRTEEILRLASKVRGHAYAKLPR